MPERRLPMRQVREILRLHFEAKLKDRQIAKICSVGKGTVRRYLKRLAAAHLSWPLSGDLDETTLEQRMFPPPPMAPEVRPLPDFNAVHKELKGRKNITYISTGNTLLGWMHARIQTWFPFSSR